MKLLIRNKIYSFFCNLGVSIGVVAAILTFIGCNNSSKRSSPVAPPAPPPVSGWQNCPGCVGAFNQGAFLATTDSENIRGSLYIGLDFYGDINSGFDFTNPKLPTFYNGMVQAIGRMQVRAMDNDLCNAPVGDYQLRTVSPGVWQNGVTGAALSGLGPANLRLEAISMSGYSFLITIAKGIIYNNMSLNGTNSLETNRLGGTFLIESFNGQVCRSLLGAAISLELY